MLFAALVQAAAAPRANATDVTDAQSDPHEEGQSSSRPRFFVDNTNPNATDSGPGTTATPYLTISAAVSQRGGPGIDVLVIAGTYREQVTVPVSGTSDRPFAILADNPSVTVSGADPFTTSSQWTLFSGNVWLASSVTWVPKQVFADGVSLTDTTLTPGSLPAGSFRYVAGTGLYVNAGGGNPAAHGALVGRRSYGFSLSARSWVSIRGFTVLQAEDKGFYVSGSSTDCEIADNRANFNFKHGIQVNASSRIHIARNVTNDNSDHGMALTGATGCIIEDNESARNAHPTVRQSNGIDLYGSPGNVIQGNRFHHNQDSGLNLRAASNDNLCVQNLSWSNGDHGVDHLAATGNRHVGDVTYGNFNDGFSIEGTSLGTVLSDCIGVDNGLTTNEYDLWVDASSTAGFVSNYNLFWNSTSQPPFKYASTTYTTLAAYSAASGQDAQSIQANPRFVSPAGGNFHLQASSPAIDSGNSGVANWPAQDADGQAREDEPGVPNTGVGPVTYAERGALEFVAGAPPPPDRAPDVTAPATATVAENSLLTVSVTASDPDGEAIASLTAILTGLPAGNNAVFTPAPGNQSGTLTWTPTFAHAGTYTVRFRAANALADTAATVVTVTNVDRAPVVVAPATKRITRGTYGTVNVTASDPDGEAITSLTADLSNLPAGHNAVFVPGPGNTSGQLQWTPALNMVGHYNVTFTATNALSGSAVTNVRVTTNFGGGAEDEPGAATQAELALSGGRPNPAHGAVVFTLDLPDAETIEWSVYDIQGRALWSERRVAPAGRHVLAWNGRTRSGAHPGAGVFLVRVAAGGRTLVRRFVLE